MLLLIVNLYWASQQNYNNHYYFEIKALPMGLCSICKGLSDDGMDEKMKKKLNLELGSFSKKMEKEDRVDSIINKI